MKKMIVSALMAVALIIGSGAAFAAQPVAQTKSAAKTEQCANVKSKKESKKQATPAQTKKASPAAAKGGK